MVQFVKNTLAMLLLFVVIYICGFNFMQLIESAIITLIFYNVMKATFNKIKAKAYKTKQ